MKDRKKFLPSQRLRKQDSFKNLVEKGTFARGRFFYAWAAPLQEIGDKRLGGPPSLGVVVNKKTLARATDRNTLKRRIREIFRKRQDEMNRGIAILVKAREGKKAPDFQSAEEDLADLFQRTGAFK